MHSIARTVSILIPLAAALNAAPAVVNDEMLTAAIQRGLTEYATSGEGPTADDLSKAIKGAPVTFHFDLPKAASPENPAESVYILSYVYLCGSCDQWHIGGTASAWALTENGLMVTNQHVIEQAEGGAMGVCDMHGKVHRVVEIVAADKENDIAVFRVDAKGLKPLPLGPAPMVGANVEVISHPDDLFFSHTYGQVSRYHQIPHPNNKAPLVQMSITADFASGSSGAPVLDDGRRVVGLVCSTQSIYTEPEDEDDEGWLQMVVKHCVPVSAISAMMIPDAIDKHRPADP